MMDIRKYKDYIAIFPKDDNRLCGLLKNNDTITNDKLYSLLAMNYSLIYGDLLTEEDFKGYAWARKIENFVKAISRR